MSGDSLEWPKPDPDQEERYRRDRERYVREVLEAEAGGGRGMTGSAAHTFSALVSGDGSSDGAIAVLRRGKELLRIAADGDVFVWPALSDRDRYVLSKAVCGERPIERGAAAARVLEVLHARRHEPLSEDLARAVVAAVLEEEGS